MSLPGLHISTPVPDTLPTVIHELKECTEWRFEVDFDSDVEIKLLSGSAEIFGTELAIQQVYRFKGIKSAIFSWYGCRLEAVGKCQVEYVAEETPVVSHANLHFALERLRDATLSTGGIGPRVLIVGPENAGKTSLARFLTSYATRSSRPAVTVNLDPKEGLLTIPGTLSAASFTTLLDVEIGWGSSPTNAPAHIPAKLPLVYFLGAETLEEDTAISKPLVSRLALSMFGRVQDDAKIRSTGCIIDSPGSISQGQPNYDMMQHVISEFQANVIVVLGSERLYSDLLRRNNGRTTVGGDTITVVKLDRSGGCVDRDDAFRQQSRQSQIKNYFFGDSKTTLSPHTQQVDFAQLAIFRRVRPSSDDESSSFLPGDFEASDNPTSVFEQIASPTLQLQNAILAIVHADLSDPHEEIRDSSVKGFVYVVEVDELKKKVKVLAPLSGRLLDKPLIWSQYPEASPDLVG